MEEWIPYLIMDLELINKVGSHSFRSIICHQ